MISVCPFMTIDKVLWFILKSFVFVFLSDFRLMNRKSLNSVPNYWFCYTQMGCLMRKPTKWLRQAKTQISLAIRPVWSESSLCAQWLGKDPSFLHADSEDWSLGWSESSLGAHAILLVLSWGCSDVNVLQLTSDDGLLEVIGSFPCFN